MYFLQVNGKFPPYYVEALCNVFGHDEETVKVYVITKCLDQSKKLIDSLACSSKTLHLNFYHCFSITCVTVYDELSLRAISPDREPSDCGALDYLLTLW